MKLTNKEIFNAKEPLSKLLQEKLPVKVSYGLAKLAAKLESQLGVIDKVRQGLFMTYGVSDPRNSTQILAPQAMIADTDDKGKVILDEEGIATMISNPKSEKFLEEAEELMAQTVELVLDPVTLPDTLEIEPAILLALGKFVTVKE